jgi:hypothetical protein
MVSRKAEVGIIDYCIDLKMESCPDATQEKESPYMENGTLVGVVDVRHHSFAKKDHYGGSR